MDHARNCKRQQASHIATIPLGRDTSCVDRVNIADASWRPRASRCTFAADAARDPVVALDSAAIDGTLPGALLRTLVALRATRSQVRRVPRTVSSFSRPRDAIRSRRSLRGRLAALREKKCGTNSLTLTAGF
jgi:hypothetical protein